MPQPGARIIHVSTSGNDAAPGTEKAPKRTLAAGYAQLRDGFADWLLLRRGDTFAATTTFFWDKSGPANGQGRMRLGAYGDEDHPRPVLDTGAGGAIVVTPGYQSSRRITNVAFTDVHLLASARVANPAGATSLPSGIQLLAVQWQGSGVPFSHLLFENVYIQGFASGFVCNRDVADLAIRRSTFHYLFSLNGQTSAMIGSPNGLLLEENVFYQIQSPDIPGLGANAFSHYCHSAYIGADAANVITRGNIVIKATEGLMQRAGGTYSRNVSVGCRIAGLIGQAWGVTPTPGGVQATFEQSLLLNATQQPFYLGNTATGTVRENLFVRDMDSPFTFDVTLVPQNAQGSGMNVGVHNTSFVDNRITGAISWNPVDTASFSGLTFANNQTNLGQTGTSIGEYLRHVGWQGSDVDDWAGHLLARDRANFTALHTSNSVIDFYREKLGLPPLD